MSIWVGWDCNPAVCLIIRASSNTPGAVSVCTFVAISAERYVAIVHPLYHGTIVTSFRTAVTIIIIWTWALVINAICLPILLADAYQAGQYCFMYSERIEKLYKLSLSLYIITFILVLYFNTQVVRAVIKQKRIIASAQIHSSTIQKTLRDKFHLAKIVFLLMGCYTICSLPFMLFILMQVIIAPKDIFPSFHRLLTYSSSLLITNTLLNVFVYSVSLKEFRSHLKELFFGKCSPKQQNNSSSDLANTPV